MARGVRQGDPLSPALFILAMDALQAMLQWAADRRLLADLGLHRRVPRASMYVDDAVVFFRPYPTDCEVLSTILELFGDASGLQINLQKSTVTYIRCDDAVAQDVALRLQCQPASF
jgi:mannosylglycoprotein endo-beta-mannosidase